MDLCSGFISESGTGFSFGLPHSAANTVAAWLNVTPTLGFGNFSSNSTGFLAKMRSQSYQDKTSSTSFH